MARPKRSCGQLLALAAAVVLSVALFTARPAAAQAFLQQELPLKPLVATPSELLTENGSQKVTLVGRQAITVSEAVGCRGCSRSNAGVGWSTSAF